MSPHLTIGSLRLGPAGIASWPELDGATAFSDNERQALAFCRQWLDGADTFVVRTSGSTGEPKPILLRREQMVASARATGAALGLHATDRSLVCLPVRYIAGQMMLARGLVLDLDMTLVEPAADPLAGLPTSAAFDFTAVVPLQLQTLLDGPVDRLDRLNRMRAILVGGGPVSMDLEQRLQAITAPVYHTYGMTETATHVALRRLDGPAASPFFHPLPGVEIDVDDRGCLRVKGPMTLDQWLQTNDLVRISPPSPHHSPLSTSHFRWLGRWDNVVNTGGVKVQVEKVELAVEQAWHELGLAPRRFLAGPLPDERLGQAVVVVIEGEPLGAESEDALLSSLRKRLDRFELPRRFVALDALVDTPTGKIDRQATLNRVSA